MQACTDLARQIAAREIDARNEIARQDLATAMAEIFTPRIRGRRHVVEVERVYRGVTVRITAPELDATDLGVLLALHAIAARDVRDLATCASRADLMPVDRAECNDSRDMSSLVVHTSVHEIARMIGRDPRDGRAAAMIRAALRHLMMVVVEGSRGQSWGANHLIRAPSECGGRVVASLNYRATLAILGQGQWAAVDMARFRRASEIERVLMHRLAAHCTGGSPLPVSLDRLAETCWTRPAKDERRQRERVSLVRAALPHVLPRDTAAVVDARGIVTFRRVAA